MATKLSDIQKRVLEVLRESKKATASQKEILAKLKDISQKDLVEQMNKLAEMQLVEFMTIGTELAFRARDRQEINKTASMDINERIIYNYIRASGNKGIWIKDIKAKSQMHTQVVNTTIKSLEKKNIIKSVKPVKNSIRKVYMLYELEPSSEITGGAWYSGQEFDTAFVDVLAEQCYKFILSRSFPKNKNAVYSASYTKYPIHSDIFNYIKNSGITSVELSRDDLQELLDRLVFDGKVVKKIKPGMGSGEWDDDDEVDEDVEYGGGRGRPRKRIKIQSLSEEEEEEEEGDDEIGGEEILGFIDDADGDEGGGEASSSTTKKINYDIWMYTAVRDSLSETSWTSVPCGRCPVFEFCTLGKGPVTPSNCVYFKEWLLKE